MDWSYGWASGPPPPAESAVAAEASLVRLRTISSMTTGSAHLNVMRYATSRFAPECASSRKCHILTSGGVQRLHQLSQKAAGAAASH